MSAVVSRLFGALGLDGSDPGFLVRETEIAGRKTKRSLFVADELHGATQLLARAIALLDDAASNDRRARAALLACFDDANDATARDFVDFHLNELPAEMRDELFGAAGVPTEARGVLERLELVGFALHPRGEGSFCLVLDYSLGKDVSDQLLAVKLDAEGSVYEVSHES